MDYREILGYEGN